MNFDKYVNEKPHPKMKDFSTKEEWNIEAEKYRREVLALRKKFQEDLAEEYELTGHPKEDKVFNMAWDRGHSAGLSEVEQEYAELASLLH